MSSNDILALYRASRDEGTEGSVLCHAPFLSLNFEQNGHVTSCCYNRSFVLGTYPEQSLREIWDGARSHKLREAFLRDEEAPGCELCFHQLKARNFGGVLMRNFDQYSRAAGYRPAVDAAAPRLLEFEISNTCNLECVMCTGYWSSSIRAHRDKLPPLHSPYDRSFVEQLEEFLPNVAGAKFLGGEPFLIERYYDIWERFARLNAGVVLTITTNATVLPKRARRLLEELRVDFVVSLDGFTAATYEAIRKNARFDVVMANVDYLLDYTRRKSTKFAIAICPMTYNWRELPELLEFCERRNIGLHFNMVLKPVEASLGGLPADQLAEVIEYLGRFQPSRQTDFARKNRQHWEGLLSQLRGWLGEKLEFDAACSDMEARLRKFASANPGSSGPLRAGLDRFERLLSPVVRSFSAARERAKVERPDFLTLLPQPARALLPEGEPSGARELLLVAHLFSAFLHKEESMASATEAAESLDREQRLLGEYVERRGASDPEWREELGVWLEEELRKGDLASLIEWVESLVDALKGDEAWQRALEEGLVAVAGSNLGDEEYRTLAGYFNGLVHRFFPRHPEWRSLPPVSSFDPPAIRDVADFHRVLDALHLFHRCYEPVADHGAFRRRLDRFVAMVIESGKTGAAFRSLESADPANVYRAMAQGSEQELRDHVDSLVP
jgi:MoaA/NifB/PqqE/SkfB family radical SAM enzyme